MHEQRQDERPSPPPRVGVLCAGNPLMRDEGVAIALRPLIETALGARPGIEVLDVGAPGLRLVWTLDRFTHVVLVDCALMGLAPGEYRVFRPDDVRSVKALTGFSAHEGDLLHVLDLARKTIEHAIEVRILGIEPATVAPGRSLSPPVATRLNEYVAVVCAIVREWSEWSDRIVPGTETQPERDAPPAPPG